MNLLAASFANTSSLDSDGLLFAITKQKSTAHVTTNLAVPVCRSMRITPSFPLSGSVNPAPVL